MLILMGLRGSGKTTVGRLVAQSLPTVFLDLDEEVLEAVTASPFAPGVKSVGEAFTTLGEEGFRMFEAGILRLLVDEPMCADAVLSLGGGTPTFPESKELIRGHIRESKGKAALVYLRATPATLAARLKATDLSSRPSLTGRGVIEEIDEVFAARDPLYRSIATRVIDVDALTPRQTADLLLKPHQNA